MKHWRKRSRHSLSARLVMLFVFMAVLFVFLVGGSMGTMFHANFKENIRPHLLRYLEYIQADIGAPPDLAKAKQISQSLPVEVHIFGTNQSWSSTDTAIDLHAIDYRRRFIENGVEYAFGEYAGREYLVSHHQDYTLAFSVSHRRDPWHWRIVAPIIILLLMLMFLYHAIRRIFAPIEHIKTGIGKIGAGQLEHRLQVRRHDELGELANSINAMADDIQQMLEAKRQLLLAISHELRSPLTRAKVSVELLEDARQRADINRELNEMEDLIAELLETERLSTRHRALNKKEVSLTGLLEKLAGEAFAGRLLTLHLPQADVRAWVDAARIKLLIKNLVDNALRHNPVDAEPVRLTLARDDEMITLSVCDFGPGIDEQHLPYLTEPFYRVDAARQRQTGGYGLGLYLCRVIAEAHGGELAISSKPGAGTEVKVRLPRENVED